MFKLNFFAASLVAGCAIASAAIAADLYIPAKDHPGYLDPDPAGDFGSTPSGDAYGLGDADTDADRTAKQLATTPPNTPGLSRSAASGAAPSASNALADMKKAASDIGKSASDIGHKSLQSASDAANALGGAVAGAMSTHTKPGAPGTPTKNLASATTPSTGTSPGTPEGLMTKPASATEPRKAGVLTCDVATGIGLIIGSTKKLDCTFTGEGREPEHYNGHIDLLGVDIGITGKSKTTWNVLAPSDEKLAPGSLAGTFTGASAEATAGVGVGGKILVSGNGNGVKLQPLDVKNQSGVDIAGGVTTVTLNYAPK